MNLRTAMITLAIGGAWSWAAPAATGVSPLMSSAAAEHRKEVDGLVISIGVVPTEQLLRTDAYERSSHRTAAASAPIMSSSAWRMRRAAARSAMPLSPWNWFTRKAAGRPGH